MPQDFETQTQIYDTLRASLTDQIPDLTDFTRGSVNEVIFNRGLAAYYVELEYSKIATQLSGWVDYAGGPIDDDDLEDLGYDPDVVSAEKVNDRMTDRDLDELVAIHGVVRDPGSFAEGEVVFTVTDDTQIVEEDTWVATRPDSSGAYYSYRVTEDTIPNTGSTEVTAPVRAVQRGNEYNVAGETIVRMPDNPTGITDVVNPLPMSGGEDKESNAELRSRAKGAPISTSGGGTVGGIEGHIENTATGVEEGDVLVDEHYDGLPEIPETAGNPYVYVIVDGGDQEKIETLIDNSRSVGMYHELRRPVAIVTEVAVTVNTVGGVDEAEIENEVVDHLSQLGLGADFLRDPLTVDVMTADPDIQNIESLSVTVKNEPHTFVAGTDVYGLNGEVADGNSPTVTGTAGGASTTFVEGTDYEVTDTNGSGERDSIDFSPSGTDPDDGTDFFVDYEADEDISIGKQSKISPGTVTASTTGEIQ
jgi:hypothetical protein